MASEAELSNSVGDSTESWMCEITSCHDMNGFAQVFRPASDGDVEALKRVDDDVLADYIMYQGYGPSLEELWTPLQLAIRKGHFDLVFYLLGWLATKGQQMTGMQWLARSSHECSSACETINEAQPGAAIKQVDAYGWTLLHHAANKGHLGLVNKLVNLLGEGEITKDLLRFINFTTIEREYGGLSAVGLARKRGHEHVVARLVELGADDMSSEKCASFIHLPAIARSVIEKHPEAINIVDGGKTCLRIATDRHHLELVDWLVGKNAAWGGGMTAWDAALSRLSNPIWGDPGWAMPAWGLMSALARKESVDPWASVYLNKPSILATVKRLVRTEFPGLISKSIYDILLQTGNSFGHNRPPRVSFTDIDLNYPFLTDGVDKNGKAEFMSMVIPFLVSEPLEMSESDVERISPTTKYYGGKDASIYLPETLDEYVNAGIGKELLDSRNRGQVLYQFYENEEQARVIKVHQIWMWRFRRAVITAATADISDSHHIGHSVAYASDADSAVANQMKKAIGSLEDEHTTGFPESIFTIFARSIASLSEQVDGYVEDKSRESIKMKEETEYIYKINDIREELSMIKTVLQQQEEVWRGFAAHAWSSQSYWPDGYTGPYRVPDLNPENDSQNQEIDIAKIARRKGEIDTEISQSILAKYLRRIASLDENAERVERSIQTRLDLKHRHFAWKETQAMSVMSAAIFGFTIVTIIFTPLSFAISLFALPVDRLTRNQQPSADGGDPVYSAGYIAKWLTITEIVTLSLTTILSVVAAEVFLEVSMRQLLRKFKEWVLEVPGRISKSANGMQDRFLQWLRSGNEKDGSNRSGSGKQEV